MMVGVSCAIAVASILGIQAAGQDDADQQVRQYRLSAENLRKMVAADNELATVQPSVAMTVDGPSSAGIEAAAKRIEEDPPALAVLSKNHISAHDYLLTVMTALFTDLLVGLVDGGQAPLPPKGVVRENIDFWRGLPSDLQATLASWKQRRLRGQAH